MPPLEKAIKEKRYIEMPPPREKDTQKAILDYLMLKGYLCWRNNTGAQQSTYKGKSRFFKYGFKGSGDIIGLTKNGTFFSIEVKAPGKLPNINQINFMDAVNKNKGISILAYSLDDVIKYL